jgi:MurNAc alpha-1-phosphate uridylyltransferase
MIFAAGFGTRMGALTRDRPKPLLVVAGRSLIDRSLDRVAAAGIARAVINLHHLGGQIRTHLAGRTDPEIRFSEEAPDILETGGGLRQALPLLAADPVLTLNPDGIWTGADPVAALAAAWDPGRMEALLLLVPRERAHAHAGPGDFAITASGRLARRGGAATAPFVYTGAQIIATRRVAAMPPGAFSLNRVWDAMAAEGRLFGTVHAGDWADAGTPAGLAAAAALLGPGG